MAPLKLLQNGKNNKSECRNNLTASVKNTVVSVWCLDQNNEKFIGSAFFISPSLLLTARHVVRNKTEQLFKNLFLRLVDGQNKVELTPKHIHCHPDLDIALIFLDVPYNSQALCTLSLQREDYLVKQVDCFGVHRENYNRDANLGYTVGTVEPDFSGYLIDHQVKKGFSGGPVALPDNRQVIGIFSQRDTTNQETLFIPLYKENCTSWLKEINDKINDPLLAEYLQPSSNAGTTPEQEAEFLKSLQELIIFIDRPANAFEHIINKASSKPVIQACHCLHSTNEDNPAEFAKALALKLITLQPEKPDQSLMQHLYNGEI